MASPSNPNRAATSTATAAIDFADLDRLIATFPVAGGRFRGDADRRLKDCVASCTHAGCPAVALIPQPRQRD